MKVAANRAKRGDGDREDWAMEDFLRYAPSFGVEPTPIQTEQVRTFVAELLRWNQKANLTAAKDPGELLIRHVLDSLFPLAHLGEAGKLLDVGPGGGFPGIPLKIFRPEGIVTLIEARRKKAAFNQHVVDRLGLQGIEVIWSRLEDEEIVRRFSRDPFDAIISRATFTGAGIISPAIRVLRLGGKILLMKGRLDRAEQGELEEEAGNHGKKVVAVSPYRLPGSNRAKNLVLIR